MFRGSFEHAIDDKGRVSVPARFRDAITASNDDRVVISNFKSETSRCLDVYTFPAWLQLEGRVRQQPQFSPRIQRFTRYYIGRAQDCQVDKQGRILIPPLLREYAKLERAVMLIGVGEKFQVWDRDAWNQVFERDEAWLFENADSLEDIGF